MDVRGKSVFLTGGARGIGRGFMEALLGRGAKVLFCDIRASLGESVEKELQAKFGAENVAFSQCDVSNYASNEAAFQAAVSKFGSVDICIFNAAIADNSQEEAMIKVNLLGPIFGCQVAVEHMRRDQGGRGGTIISVASEVGLQPFGFIPTYSASKHGVIGYFTSQARNPLMKEMGIRWKCFLPRGTNTEFTVTDPTKILAFDKYQELCKVNSMEVSTLVEIFLNFLDQKSDDVIFLVEHDGTSRYVRRQVANADDESKTVTLDQPQDVPAL